jgi:hypothetical protein
VDLAAGAEEPDVYESVQMVDSWATWATWVTGGTGGTWATVVERDVDG